jgi:integrase
MAARHRRGNAEDQREAEAARTQPRLLPPMRLYDARHTCATLLLEAGEHLKVVQEVLGHSTIALTADLYSHVRPEMARLLWTAWTKHGQPSSRTP